MRKEIIKKTGGILLSAILIVSTMAIPASANQGDLYQISTVEELKSEINYHLQDQNGGDMQVEIAEKTDPNVIADFLEEKTEIAKIMMKNLDPDSLMKQGADGTYRGSTSVDLGDGCTAVVEFEDGEDNIDLPLSPLSKAKYESLRLTASNPETMWKDYGNRYFTASTWILSGIGSCKISLENHYTLSAKGIDERYGDAYENIGFNVGIIGNVSHGDVIISDASARTPGKSDVNMYVRFNWYYDGQGQATVQGNTKLSTTVGFVDINKSAKQIKVKHSWKID